MAQPAHVRKAAAAIDLGNYVEAAKEYEAAYMDTSDPAMLVSVGQAWLLAGDRQKALTAYRSYVRVAPMGDQRVNCEARIRELESAGQPSATGWAPAAAVPVVPVAAPAPLPSQPVAPAWRPEPPSAALVSPPSEARVVDSSGVGWPFWATVGAVVITGMVLGYFYLRHSDDLAMPDTTFGAKHF